MLIRSILCTAAIVSLAATPALAESNRAAPLSLKNAAQVRAATATTKTSKIGAEVWIFAAFAIGAVAAGVFLDDDPSPISK